MIQDSIKKYWEENIEEKEKLEKEKKQLKNKIEDLNSKLNLIIEDSTIEELSESLKMLNKERSRIFVFKKRKKR